MAYSEHDIARFWDRVDTGEMDECWLWKRGRQSAGYGVMTTGTERKQTLAHRIACEIEHGPPTEDRPNALHSCDTPACCNPKHLRWGSQRHNTEDAIKRERASMPPKNVSYRRYDTQPKGAAVWNQSLTEAQVREIWRLHIAGGMTRKAIAEAVGGGIHPVRDVIRGKSWRHLEGAPSLEQLRAGGVKVGANQFTRFPSTESA